MSLSLGFALVVQTGFSASRNEQRGFEGGAGVTMPKAAAVTARIQARHRSSPTGLPVDICASKAKPANPLTAAPARAASDCKT